MFRATAAVADDDTTAMVEEDANKVRRVSMVDDDRTIGICNRNLMLLNQTSKPISYNQLCLPLQIGC